MSAITLDALRVACASDDHHRHALRSPMLAQIDCEDWTVATDGHRLLAARGVLADGLTSSPFVTSIEKFYRDALVTPARPVATAALRAFFFRHAPPAGECPACKGSPTTKCTECGGTGDVDCECIACGDAHSTKCAMCEGDGQFRCTACVGRPPIVPAAIDGNVFNALTVAPLFAVLPDEIAQIGCAGPLQMTTLRGDGWFVAIMPLRTDGTNIPTFRTQGRPA